MVRVFFFWSSSSARSLLKSSMGLCAILQSLRLLSGYTPLLVEVNRHSCFDRQVVSMNGPLSQASLFR